MKKLLLLASLLAALATGFAAGIYALPIMIAPPSPSNAMLTQIILEADYTAEFDANISGSDFLHWGEGRLGITGNKVAFIGELAPGPDYRLYLVPEYVNSDKEFLAVKSSALQLGEVNTFKNFLVEFDDGVNFAEYNTLLVWCETFQKYISATRFR
ncbi:DM13 domain-containing protein [Aliamphritea ceti]|uniref:DM13 domain-containing protein n=1 Tax=Aliamphritea ceti TaxID=1524258 RepID=UPI0021C37E64|nr:DM13 domain-containing protein [Aliamphritea ceti]